LSPQHQQPTVLQKSSNGNEVFSNLIITFLLQSLNKQAACNTDCSTRTAWGRSCLSIAQEAVCALGTLRPYLDKQPNTKHPSQESNFGNILRKSVTCNHTKPHKTSIRL